MGSRTRRTALALAFGIVALGPPGGPSFGHGAGPVCSSGEEPITAETADCEFVFRGTPIQVVGTATDPEGLGRTIRLRVWVHEENDHQRLGPMIGHETTTLTECTIEGAGEVTCAGKWPTEQTVDLAHPLLTQTVYLRCHVQAEIVGSTTAPSLRYGCSSSYFDPGIGS